MTHAYPVVSAAPQILESALAEPCRKVLSPLYARRGRGRVGSSKAEQGLECRHRVLAPLVAKDKLIEVDLELIPTYPMVSTNKPLL